MEARFRHWIIIIKHNNKKGNCDFLSRNSNFFLIAWYKLAIQTFFLRNSQLWEMKSKLDIGYKVAILTFFSELREINS